MQYKKEFWIAMFLFLCTLIVITSLLRSGFASYKICGLILFPCLGIGFLRQAMRK